MLISIFRQLFARSYSLASSCGCDLRPPTTYTSVLFACVIFENDKRSVFLSLKYLLSYLTVIVFLLLENLDYEAVPSFLFSALFKDFSVRPFRPLVFSSLYEVISLSISSLNLCLLGKTKWPPALLFVLTS